MGSFDVTLFEALLSAGVSPERARAVIDELERAVDGRYMIHSQILATKRDLAELELRLLERFASVDARFGSIDSRFERIEARFQVVETRFQVVETHFQAVETRIAEAKVDLVRWMLTALTAQTALLVGAIKLF